MSKLTPLPEPTDYNVESLFNEACTHYQAGRLREAETYGELTLEQDGSHADAMHLLAVVLLQTNRADTASKLVLRALELKPDNADYLCTLGNILAVCGQAAGAVIAYEKAVAIKPDHAGAYSNLGAILKQTGRLDEAVNCYQLAASLEPTLPHPLNNLGIALLESARFDEAVTAFRGAIALQKDFVEAHFNLGRTLMLQGDVQEGLREFEWRTQLRRYAPKRVLRQPMWNGRAMEGAVLFIHAEPDLGDMLNFIRYVAHAAARVGRVIVECPPMLKRLFAGWPSAIHWVSEGDELPNVTVQCHLLSLPHLLRTDGEVPMHLPEFRGIAQDAGKWRERIAATASAGNLKVGLAWTGPHNDRDDIKRSISLDSLAPLAKVPGVTFYSLEKSRSEAQPVVGPEGMSLVDLSANVSDFADAAGLISQLDLVISVDAAVAHLAGGMGKPVWTLLPAVPDWRWQLSGEETAWYETMRLFRQASPGNWAPVVERVAAELAKLKPA